MSSPATEPDDRDRRLHLFFFPFMSPGHQIPMTDMARIFAAHGVRVGIVTTPVNASRFRSIIDRDRHRHLITLHVIEFPSAAVDLPAGCENLDAMPSRHLSSNFSRATTLLRPQSDDLVRLHRPDAIVSDQNLPYTAEIAKNHNLPRLVFHGTSCFSLCVNNSVAVHKPHADVVSDTTPFLVPELPDEIHITKSHMPERFFGNLNLGEFFKQFAEAEKTTYGVVSNTFSELESEYVNIFERICNKKVYPIGPVSLFNETALDMAERGKKASIDENQILQWLDSKQDDSVLYVCFGSLCCFAESQLLEIWRGLEASNKSFVWIVRENQRIEFVEDDLEKKVSDRGLIVRGWAPQVLILNHPATGGFVTHCGWNSVLESVSAGVPMITWPLFAEQFYNESFVLNRLRIGVGIGVDTGMAWGEEETAGVLVHRDRVEAAVTRLMDGGEEMRKRASGLGESARLAVKRGGSSEVNISRLIEDLLNRREERLSKLL